MSFNRRKIHRICICVILFVIAVGNITIPERSNTQRTQQRRAYKYNATQNLCLCNETNRVVNAVYNRALLTQSEAGFWQQEAPFSALNCEQLVRSIPSHILKNGDIEHDQHTTDVNGTPRTTLKPSFDLSLQRLAEKLQKLENGSSSNPLKIVVIGGSMTTGMGYGRSKNDPRSAAWPRKLEQFMHEKWNTTHQHNSPVQVINLALGGADENTWLGGMDIIMNHAPFDIILVESAVNDQCDFKDQESKEKEVDRTSNLLLNMLMNFPNEPAVISVELFRVAGTSKGDANLHCRGHVKDVKNQTNNKECLYCPQWWKPQDWRKKAREKNSVSHVSYRDAVWPILNQPPPNLCHQYWTGLSHPQAGTQTLVASTILFQLMTVMHMKDELVGLLQDGRRTGKNNKVELTSMPKTVCLNPISSYRAIQDDPHNPMDVDTNENENKDGGSSDDSCWEFRADVQKKYGWICEHGRNTTMNRTKGVQEKYDHFSKNVDIGGDGKLIISRLVSYDTRMAKAQVWFSTSSADKTKSNSETSINIFQGDPVWNITSWHESRTSIPQPVVIELGALEFKPTITTNLQWPSKSISAAGNEEGATDTKSSTLEVTFNMRMLVGSSAASHKDTILGVDKFKLLGIVTC
eukprot:scaffold91610_cov58-Attheya_sp.AAC.7